MSDRMSDGEKQSDRRGVIAISALAGLIGGLCCATPIVLVLLGLASITMAADLGNVLYGDYRWIFRLVALAFMALALWFYFRRRGICTLDQARRERNRIINTSLVVLIFAVGIYFVIGLLLLSGIDIERGRKAALNADSE